MVEDPTNPDNEGLNLVGIPVVYLLALVVLIILFYILYRLGRTYIGVE